MCDKANKMIGGIIKLQERRVSPEIIMVEEAAEIENSSKDEIYVDSRAWLGSDSEDDYYSVKEYTPSSPARTRMRIMNLYYNNAIHTTPPPPPAPARAVIRKQKPLVELLKDPYWSEQQIKIKEGNRQMRLVEFFIEDSFWEKEFSLTTLSESHKDGASSLGNGKARSKRVHKDEPKLDGCCIPKFWSKKRKTKLAAVS